MRKWWDCKGRGTLLWSHDKECLPLQAEFCKDTMCTPVMQSFIDDNFVFWMDSISSAEGYRVSSMLRVSSYPYVAVVTTTQDGRTAGKMTSLPSARHA